MDPGQEVGDDSGTSTRAICPHGRHIQERHIDAPSSQEADSVEGGSAPETLSPLLLGRCGTAGSRTG